jgi:hypothetical protein
MRAITIYGPVLTITMLSLACTVVEPDDDNPFGTAPPASSSPPASDTGDETETGGSSTGGGGSSSGVAESTGGVADSSSGGGPDPTTGGVSMGDSTTDDGGGNGMQPGDGMWSACEVADDCGFSPTLCITITDEDMMLIGGFCSETGCQNPAADCDPSPAPTVTPVCVPVNVDGMATNACALQCTGGAACPVPMQCLNVMGFGEICA